MKKDRLFNVLVMGGILLTAPALQADATPAQAESQAILQELLESEPIPSVPAFCSKEDENTCVVDEAGQSVPKAGIHCCWSTTCES